MRRLIQCLIFLCFGLALSAQPLLQGRWLFQGVSETGRRVPLFIIDFSAQGGPRILSSSAPFELSLKDVKVEGDSVTIAFLADQSQLTLTGTIAQGSIKGKAVGETLSGLTFRADPTDQTKLTTISQPTGEEIDDYQSARQSGTPSEQVSQLRAFLKKYPQSALKTAALAEILNSSLEADAKDEEILELIDQTIQASTDKATVQNDIAYSLAEKKRLPEKALELAQAAVAGAEPGTGAQANFLDTLGWVFYRQGNVDLALAKLQEAARISPRRSDIAVHLAEVLTAAKRQPEAVEAYVQAFAAGNRPAGTTAEDLYRKIHGSLEGFHELIDRAYAKQPPLFDAGRFEGQYSGPGVVAELFTGAQCGPCQAADYGFDGLLQHFPESVLTVLEYHVHVPGPDPMTSPDSIARARFYKIRSTPTAIFSGTDKQTGGGSMNRSEIAFRGYLPAVMEQSARKTDFGIDLKVSLDHDQLAAEGLVRNPGGSGTAEKPQAKSDSLRLFVALVEKTVHYTGANGVHLHHNVVRKFLNDAAEGTAVKTGETPFKYTASLPAVEAEFKQYLDGMTGETGLAFDDAPLVLDRNDLAIAAFVQNVETGEILVTKVVSAH